MTIDSSVSAIVVFVILMVALPLVLGLLCRKLAGVPEARPKSWWVPLALVLTVLGWGIAFALGKLGIMSYPASVLLGAVLYLPGLFLWGFHARIRTAA